jgi:hypothetical protein
MLQVGSYVDVTFVDGNHPVHHTHQYECKEIIRGVTVKYLVDNHSTLTPTATHRKFRGRITRISHVSANKKFMVVRVNLLQRLKIPSPSPEIVIVPPEHRVRQQAREEFERARRFRY